MKNRDLRNRSLQSNCNAGAETNDMQQKYNNLLPF
ncbi:MAG: hypothetical protein JWM03_141 [Rhodocyclales bacterium]|nr:hypothetical protein [Rhodocyclales bacterium]MDB5887269.1 hypothetical protein [Rhodocyclales bacterium]